MKIIMTFFFVLNFSQMVKAQFDHKSVLKSIFHCQNNNGIWTQEDKRISLKLTLMAIEAAKNLGDSPEKWKTNNSTIITYIEKAIAETKHAQEKKQLYPIIISILNALNIDATKIVIDGNVMNLITDLNDIILNSQFTDKELITPYIPLLKKNQLSAEANNKIVGLFSIAQRDDGGWSYNLNRQIGSSLDITAEIISTNNKSLLTELVLAKAINYIKSKNNNEQFFERSDSIFTRSRLKKIALLSKADETNLLEKLSDLMNSKSMRSEIECSSLIYIAWAFANEKSTVKKVFEARINPSSFVISDDKNIQPVTRVIIKNLNGNLNIDKTITFRPVSFFDPLQNRQVISEQANGFTVILKTLNDENIKYKIDEKLGAYVSEIQNQNTSGWVLFHNGVLWSRGMPAIKIKNNDMIEFYESSTLKDEKNYRYALIAFIFAFVFVAFFIWKRK